MHGKVFFLAVARAFDKVIVASAPYNSMKIDLGAVKKMLTTMDPSKAMKKGQLYSFSTAGQDPASDKVGLMSKASDGFAWSILEIDGCV
jgi:hypothetical protein